MTAKLAVIAVSLSLTTACSPARVPGSEPPSNTASAAITASQRLDDLLSALSVAIEHRDAAAWRSLLAGADSGFSPDPAMLFENLIRLDKVSFVATGRTHEVSASRRATLGSDAQAKAVRVTWSLPGETQQAQHTIWLTTVTRQGRSLLAGATDGPSERERDERDRLPLWLLEPIRVSGTGAILLTGDNTDSQSWLDALDRARRAVGEDTLVAELPSNTTMFRQLLGASPGEYDQIAAVSTVDGANTDHTPIRIMLNPGQVARLTPLARSFLLTHEAVHVRTRSPLAKAPLPITEGYADLVAYRANPDAVPAAIEALRNQLRTQGIPPGLPDASDFDPTSPRISSAYPRAWIMAEVIDKNQGLAPKVYADCAAGMDWSQALARYGWTESSLTAALAARLQQIAA